MRTKIAKEDIWYLLSDNRFIHFCCRCKLEHLVRVKVVKKKVAIGFFRMPNKDAMELKT